MRRLEPWLVGVGVAGAAGLASGFSPVGALFPLQALRAEGLGSPAARPQLWLLRLLEPILGLEAGLMLLCCLLMGAGAALLWEVRRREGASVGTAVAATALGALPPVLHRMWSLGLLELLAMPLVVGALATARLRPWLSGLLILLCGLADARLGLLCGLGAGLGAGRWGLAWAGLLAATVGSQGSADLWTLDPTDAVAPFVEFRPEGLVPGLALVLAWILGAVESGWGRVYLFGLVAAAGPVLQLQGEPLAMGGAALPLPGVILALFSPHGHGWSAGLLVASVAGGLSLRAELRLLLPLALLWAVELGLMGLPATTSLKMPLGIEDMRGGTGRILHLPLEIQGQVRDAPPGSHSRYQWWGHLLERETMPGLEAMGMYSPLYGEPLVVLNIDVVGGTDRYLIPPELPGSTLSTLGISQVVLHIDGVDPQGLAVLRGVYARWLGAAQRDPSGLEIYPVPKKDAVRMDPLQVLRESGQSDTRSWKTMATWLREVGKGNTETKK
jgi:hypothetical protein